METGWNLPYREGGYFASNKSRYFSNFTEVVPFQNGDEFRGVTEGGEGKGKGK